MAGSSRTLGENPTLFVIIEEPEKSHE